MLVSFLDGSTKEFPSLSSANLRNANLRNANLRFADLSITNLSFADLRSADLRSANLYCADLSQANLSGANLSAADLREANLSCANLRDANIISADLSYANIISADISYANLIDANLRYANLSDANLSGAKGLLNPSHWMRNNFNTNLKGFIVYKAFHNTHYKIPNHWIIEPSQVIEEEVNSIRTLSCGCGVNFGTKEYVLKNFKDSEIWECLLEWVDLLTVCVPYNTDGKARCGKLTLLRKVS